MLGQMPLMMGQVHQVQTPLARRPITGGPQLSGYPGPGPAQLPGYRPQPGPFPTSPGAGPQHAPQYRQVAIYLFIIRYLMAPLTIVNFPLKIVGFGQNVGYFPLLWFSPSIN